MILCKSDGFAKFYAIILLALMACITVGDYWVIGAVIAAAKNSGVSNDVRNYTGFRICATWFLQLGLYLNAAWDAWDTDDEKKVNMGDVARR